jgi:putative tryptophan/tyrosine transport system substrate-binding protein
MQRREFIAAVGGAAAWPIAARGQQRAVPVVGYLSALSHGPYMEPFTKALSRGLGEQGYIDGQNVEILYRWAGLQYDRLPMMAADLVRRRVAAIFADGTSEPARAARAATATIPIVFATGADPVALGLVTSLNHPGGNVTGVAFLATALVGKRLELLHEVVPAARLVGYLTNRTDREFETRSKEAQIAANILGVQLANVNASSPKEIEEAFANLVEQHVGALLIEGDVLFSEQSEQLAALAARHALPAIYISRGFVDAGGLMSYGPSLSDAFRLAGTYIGRILKGEKPTDLPVQQSTRIEMVLNLKTAKTLGIDPVPTATLLRATEVIE